MVENIAPVLTMLFTLLFAALLTTHWAEQNLSAEDAALFRRAADAVAPRAS